MNPMLSTLSSLAPGGAAQPAPEVAPAANTNAAASPAAAGAPDAQASSLRQRTVEAALKFEGLFVSEMLKQMRRGSAQLAGPDAMFKPPEDNPLLALADTLVADAMAGQRAFGIADAILRQLLPEAAGSAGAPPFKSAPAAVAPSSQGLRADADPLLSSSAARAPRP